MDEVEGKILSLLDSGRRIDDIIEELKIDKESMADIIIGLDTNGLVCLKNKNWVLTRKGHDMLNEIKESLRNLKFDYLDGNISRDEFLEKRKKLEYVVLTEKPKQGGYVITKGKDVICSKCGTNNNVESRYCYKCGSLISDV